MITHRYIFAFGLIAATTSFCSADFVVNSVHTVLHAETSGFEPEDAMSDSLNFDGFSDSLVVHAQHTSKGPDGNDQLAHISGSVQQIEELVFEIDYFGEAFAFEPGSASAGGNTEINFTIDSPYLLEAQIQINDGFPNSPLFNFYLISNGTKSRFEESGIYEILLDPGNHSIEWHGSIDFGPQFEPNFDFSIGSFAFTKAVPEPSICTLLALGMFFGHRRSRSSSQGCSKLNCRLRD